MRVLWLSALPSNAGKILKDSFAGGGWIASLENEIRQVPNLELGVGFFYPKQVAPFEHEGVRYFPIARKYTGLSGKIKYRLSNNLIDSNLEGIKEVVREFAPDVIHIFGSESGMGEISGETDIPVIIHIQGLVRPYLSAYLPKAMSERSLFSSSSLRAILFRRGYFFEYNYFKKNAEREDKILRQTLNFFGRTAWDKNYLGLVKKDFYYVHCEEMLRPFFFEHEWVQPATGRFRIVSIINPQLYKGLEMVLETAAILKDMAGLDFIWHVIGIKQDEEIVPIFEKYFGRKFNDYPVVLRGSKTESELIEELQQAHVYLHPSHIENSSNAVCEAMLLGMPVVAGDAGGMDSIVQDGHDGIIYNSYDAYRLAGIIKDVAGRPEYLLELGKNARKRGKARHDSKEIVKTVVETYKLLANKNSKPGSHDSQ